MIDLKFVTVETFVIQFVILVLVIWILNKFVFKPYLAYLDEWETKQKKVQEDYNNAEAILEEKRKEGESILEKARSKGNAVIEEAESLALTKKEKILADAETQAREQAELAKNQIEKERQSMLSGAKKHIMDIALKINDKMFQNEKASKDFVEKHIDTL